jgi:hypothetical protein
VLSHYVLWNATPALANLLGLAKGKDSHYKHKVITLKLPEPRHPIMLGLPDTFTLADECFWNLQGDRSKITALATSDETVGDKVSAEPIIWASRARKRPRRSLHPRPLRLDLRRSVLPHHPAARHRLGRRRVTLSLRSPHPARHPAERLMR